MKTLLTILVACLWPALAWSQYLSFLGNPPAGGGAAPAFDAPVGKFTIATDANHWGATEQWWDGPQYCESGSMKKLLTAYLDGVSSSDTKKIRVKSVDLTDGGVTVASANFSRNFDGNATHDRPFLWVDPDDKKVWVFYGAEEAYGITTAAIAAKDDAAKRGVFYQVSANPCALDFTGEQDARTGTTPMGGNLAQFPAPRKDVTGVMHFFVQGGASNGAYFQRSAAGVWSDINVRFVENDNNSTCGVPQPFSWVLEGSNNLHLAWTSSNSAGQNRGIWYVKSTDGGANWCNVAGANCVTPGTGFNDSASSVQCSGDTLFLRSYSGNYQVKSDTTQDIGGPALQIFSGSPVILSGEGSGITAYYRSGGSWTTSTVVTGLSGGPRGHVLVQTDTELVAVYIESTTSDIFYKTSADGGATWSPSGLGTMLEDFSSETAAWSARNIGCSAALPGGETDWRVFCSWSVHFDDGNNDGTPQDADHDEIRAEIFVP